MYFIITAYGIHVVLPRLLSAEEFGLYSTTINFASILNNVLIAATVQSVSKFVSEDEAKAPFTLRQGLRIQAAVGTILALTVFFAAPAFGALQRDAAVVPLVRITAVVLLVYALYGVAVGALNGMHRFGTQARLDMGFSTLRMLAILGGAGLAGHYFGVSGVAGAVGGFALAAASILLVALSTVGLGRAGEQRPLRQWLRFIMPVWLYQGCLNGILLIDALVLKPTVAGLAMERGASAQEAASIASSYVGMYSAGQRFAFVPYQLLLSLTFIVFPMVSKAVSSGDDQAAQRTLSTANRFALIVLMLLAVPIAGAAEGVVGLVYTPDYYAGAASLRVLIFGAAMLALFVVNATALSGSGEPGLAAVIGGLGLATVVIGNVALLKATGLGEDLAHAGPTLAAGAAGTSLGMGLAMLLSAGVVYQRFGTWLPWSTVARAAVATAAGFAVARFIQGGGAWAVPASAPGLFPTLGALVGAGLSVLLVLVATRELGAADWAAIRQVARRGPKR